MARTVPYTAGSTIQPVVPNAAEHGEILDTKRADTSIGFAGLAPLALTVNGLDEQKRHTLVADYNPGGILLSPFGGGIFATGATALYRAKIMGHRDLGTVYADVWLWLTANDSGDNNPTDAQVDVTSTGGASTVSWNHSGSDVPTITKTYLGTVNVLDDASEWENFTVTISNTGEDSLVDVSVFGIDVVYQRATNAIPAGEYTNGQTSQDLSAYAGERPVSTARDRDMAGNLVQMYQERVGQVQSSATPLGLAYALTVFGCTVPADVTELAVHVYDTSGVQEILVVGTTSSATIAATGGTWGSCALTVQPETAQRILISQLPDGDSIKSICAWWRDSAKAGEA